MTRWFNGRRNFDFDFLKPFQNHTAGFANKSVDAPDHRDGEFYAFNEFIKFSSRRVVQVKIGCIRITNILKGFTPLDGAPKQYDGGLINHSLTKKRGRGIMVKFIFQTR